MPEAYTHSNVDRTVPQPQRTVGSTLGELYSTSDQLSEIAGRLERLTILIYGGDPEGKGASQGPSPPRPPHLVGSMEFLSMRMNSLSHDIGRYVGRIEAAIDVPGEMLAGRLK